ncbi:MAG: tetratricopeptide repeat protein, partial [Verrucomicrobiota bacterium]
MTAAPERHKWLFRFLAVTLIPLLFFGSAELGLRLAGYGYPTRFFQKSRMGERVVLVENEKFGRRFFPPSLAREPRPLILAPEKPADTIRIFVFGESAAMGDPEPAYGFSRILEVLLRERFPGRRFEVVNVAMTAINSHAILPLARECARLQGDVWVIYMGNNEVEGPFGSGTIFGPKAPGMFFIRASLALKTARIGQLLDDLQSRLLEKTAAPKSWGGMKMFMEHQIRQEDPGMEMVYRHFQSNLEDIVQVGKKSGAKILASTVGSNLRHCAPFASLHAAGLKETDQSAWGKMYASGVILESAGQFQEALALYRQAARIDDRHAELQFRMGRCSWESGIYDQARRSFERARDLDTLRFRADSRLNEIIRRVGG